MWDFNAQLVIKSIALDIKKTKDAKPTMGSPHFFRFLLENSTLLYKYVTYR